jgi:hypothetical protein
MDKITVWNRDQIQHTQLVQKQVLEFTTILLGAVIEHDTSKWSDLEYKAFLDSHNSLRSSTSGTDPEYQKHLKGEAIQHHITTNPHHPEYWDARGELMPLHEIISMFFDWRARSIAKGDGMDGFWQYNLDKLKKQPHAIPVVEALKREYAKEKK